MSTCYKGLDGKPLPAVNGMTCETGMTLTVEEARKRFDISYPDYVGSWMWALMKGRPVPAVVHGQYAATYKGVYPGRGGEKVTVLRIDGQCSPVPGNGCAVVVLFSDGMVLTAWTDDLRFEKNDLVPQEFSHSQVAVDVWFASLLIEEAWATDRAETERLVGKRIENNDRPLSGWFAGLQGVL